MSKLLIMQATVNVMPEEKLNELMTDTTKEYELKTTSKKISYYVQNNKPEEIINTKKEPDDKS